MIYLLTSGADKLLPLHVADNLNDMLEYIRSIRMSPFKDLRIYHLQKDNFLSVNYVDGKIFVQ